MFALPTIPTDNFYKFLTISGLALVLYSFYLIHSNTEKSIESYEEWKKNTKEITNKMNEYNYRLSEMNYYSQILNIQSQENRLRIIDSLQKSDTTLENHFRSLIYRKIEFSDTTQLLIRQRIVEIIKKLDDIVVQFSTTNNELNDEYVEYLVKTKFSKSMSWMIFFIGLFVFLFGLIQWHRKHQFLQDKLLKMQIEESDRKISK